MVFGMDRKATEAELLEDAATVLLRAAGRFRRGTGIRSPRSMREAARGEVGWQEWHDREIVAVGSCVLWEEVDAIAAAARLTAREKAVLSMARVEEYSLREMAEFLGLTVHQVRRSYRQALRKCRRLSPDACLTVAALFREEVRQKSASIYRRPVHSWRTRRTIG
ncbi:MAG TPA: sigma factor-like helix-turn-helix DNA-binding protein [Armatimonadota bacterium]|nr:sigma factor-like helix-turn-helix DNA-binding protein [Armatimonadota bacterium]